MNRPLLESFSASPLLLSESSAEFFQGAINFIVAHEHSAEMLDNTRMSSEDDFWDDDEWFANYRPYNVKDGILQVPVSGVLLNNFPFQLGRWATGYAYIEKAMQRGMADDNVKGIVLVCDSPGGEVAGCFELTDSIFEARGEKPIRAVSANAAYSAAYSIASATDDITVTRSGGTGSVGVVTAHVDYSKAMEQNGIKVTFFKFGAHKTDGNPYEPLSDKAAKRIQARIDKLGAVFVSTVARNRDMDEDAVQKTEALTYDAEDSVAIGFADQVGTLEESLSGFFGNEDNAEGKDTQMTIKTNPKPNATNEDAGVDQATHDKAVADARAEGVTAGVKQERDRMDAILGSDEAKDRPNAAMAAVESGMDAAAATKMLGRLPKEDAKAADDAPKGKSKDKAGATPFDSHMKTSGNPNVGADTEDDNDDEPDHASSILNDFSAFTGKPRKTA